MIELDNTSESDNFAKPGEKVETTPGNFLPTEETSAILTDEERAYFENALLIGSHSKTGYVFGHKVRVQTLTAEEEILAATLVDKYQDSISYPRAYRTATVAAYTREIDDKPIYTPLSPQDAQNAVQGRYDVLSKYYPAFIDMIYAELVETADEEVNTKLRAKLGK